MSLPGKLPDPRCSGAKRSNGATRARNVRRYGYSASRAPCHTVLLGAAPAVFQPRGGPSNPKNWHHKKSGAEHSIQRHSSSPTGLSGGCAKPIFDHAHERSAKRQGEQGLILCPLMCWAGSCSSSRTTRISIAASGSKWWPVHWSNCRDEPRIIPTGSGWRSGLRSSGDRHRDKMARDNSPPRRNPGRAFNDPLAYETRRPDWPWPCPSIARCAFESLSDHPAN